MNLLGVCSVSRPEAGLVCISLLLAVFLVKDAC